MIPSAARRYLQRAYYNAVLRGRKFVHGALTFISSPSADISYTIKQKKYKVTVNAEKQNITQSLHVVIEARFGGLI